MLDAEIESVVEPRAFRARLGNGHMLTAFLRKGSPQAERLYCVPGSRVRVRMSPFDMSQGEIMEMVR